MRTHRACAVLLQSVLIALIGVIPITLRGQHESVEGVPVEVVATASEYIPTSRTISHPGHSYTDCMGNTSYFGNFNDYGSVGSASGTASANTHCNTTFNPPTETTLTDYRRVNYTIVMGGNAVYRLACTQTWKLTRRGRFFGAVGAIAAGASGNTSQVSRNAGKWSECPAFVVGSKYTLTVQSASNAQLEETAGAKPSKLEYMGSSSLTSARPKPEPLNQTAPSSIPATAKVHVTSLPSGAEIYVDGRYYGDTPSDITLTTGAHLVKVTIGGREWSRTVQVTAGEISIHASITQ